MMFGVFSRHLAHSLHRSPSHFKTSVVYRTAVSYQVVIILGVKPSQGFRSCSFPSYAIKITLAETRWTLKIKDSPSTV